MDQQLTPNLTPIQLKVLTPLYKEFQLIIVEGGRFGNNVIMCKDNVTNEVVAIQVLTIHRIHKHNGFPSTIIKPVSILKELNHPNIVRLLKVIATEDDVFLVFEYLDINLKRLLANPFSFSIRTHIRFILREALSGLSYCHSHKILHRDLRPHSILLKIQDLVIDGVKLCDFGVAKPIEPPLTPYCIHMGNPCYKAPELLLGSTNYSTAIDIWSIGCIFAEMIKNKPLFVGIDEPRILSKIFCLLGTPTEETWPGVSSICNYIEDFDPPVEPKDLAEEFPSLQPDALHLLTKMLCLCPKTRISADEALNHPYLQL